MSYSSIDELNQVQQYMMQMRPLLNKAALFSDGTKDFRQPAEPNANDDVTIRFRTRKDNVDIVWLCHAESKIPMNKSETIEKFDYYSTVIKLKEAPYYYYFELETGNLHCFYDRVGPSKSLRKQYQFCIIPGFSTPDWAKGAVMYQIFVDRFFNADSTNDVKSNEYFYIKTYGTQVDKWKKVPAHFGVGEFYGGDLLGVIQKLDYLQDLGIDVIYFNPLFVSPSNHKYDIQDYDYIDPHYGVILDDGGDVLPDGVSDNKRATKYITRVTGKRNLEASNKMFAFLVDEAHRRGIKIILDGVFNHCGSFNKWIDREQIYDGQEGYEKGAYLSQDSPYRKFFKFNDEKGWPNNASYDGWWGHDTLPKLNYEGSKELYDYIIEIGKKWVSPPYNADGWRLDVAADLGHSKEFNHQFWRDFRTAVKQANPQALILAEHYGDPKEWLQGDQWDTVMNYDAFMEPLTWFLTGMEKHSDEFRWDTVGNLSNFEGAMSHFMHCLLTPSMYCSMNELSNHDHSRFLTRTNRKVGRVDRLGSAAAAEGVNKGIFKEAVVVQMTWPGAPTIYYGDEAGLCGFTDPDNRRTYPWGREDKELLSFHKEIIRIHKENEALRIGSVKFLNGQNNLLGYGRFTKEQQIVILVNNDSIPRKILLEVWAIGLPYECTLLQLISTTREGHSMEPVKYQVLGGVLDITLPEYASIILKGI
ncbi:glycoside hydrolase family 13 protein [Lachnospiraceae bacterium ZAX-1]